jgi:putative transposase
MGIIVRLSLKVEILMAGTRSVAITLSTRQQKLLERLARSKKASQQLVERCRIVLLSAAGRLNTAQAQQLGVNRQRVRRWRHRWAEESAGLSAAETAGASDADLQGRIVQVLNDGARSGAPAKFSAEQIAGLIALACEPPSDSGLPVSHWTPPELAREAVKRGLVESISPRQVDRFLAQRTCDRTRVNTGSHRGTNVKTLSNTKPMSKRCASCIDKLPSLQNKARTW